MTPMDNIFKTLVVNKKTKAKIDEFVFSGQTDGITFNGTDGFVSIQDQDALLHFRLIEDKLEIIRTLPGFSFPHGLASTLTTLGVSNYGDNSIDLLKIADFVNI